MTIRRLLNLWLTNKTSKLVLENRGIDIKRQYVALMVLKKGYNIELMLYYVTY